MPDWESVVAEATAADGAAPLDEATLRVFRQHPDEVTWWQEAEGFAAYVGEQLHLVVRPESRGHGIGRMLAERALGFHEGTSLAWSHGDHPAAAALAARFDFSRVRELHLMQLPTDTPVPEISLPEGVLLGSYDPSYAEEILRVNAAAFAHHPEQGGMDAADLAERMAEPWFDPEGLLLALDETTGAVLGFHWTKVHSASTSGPTLGEVYVVAVDPAAQGRGIGSFITLAGVYFLIGAEVDLIELYVESDNTVALATYSRLGFTHAATHVMYRR